MTSETLGLAPAYINVTNLLINIFVNYLFRKYADIAPLLDVEDMVKMKKPDWKCVFCYVQSFYRKLKDHDNNRAK